jgi:glutamate synthase (NADPH/NADH) large chain
MTGGRVVILGKTGRNFGAGMSGGVAYVWDKDKDLAKQCNTETFELEAVSDAADIAELKTLISRHLEYTESPVAAQILANWDTALAQFVKVMPTDYKRVLNERAKRIHAQAVAV